MQINVRGLREIEDQLIKLGSKDGTRILRRATYQAGEPIVVRAKGGAAALPNGSGALEKSITKRVTAGPKSPFGASPEIGSRFSVQIFPKTKDRIALALHNLFYRRKRKGIFYGHFLEWGHRIATRKTGRLKRNANSKAGGQSAGEVAPRPIFRTALRIGASAAIKIFRSEVEDGIAKQLKRNARKPRKSRKK